MKNHELGNLLRQGKKLLDLLIVGNRMLDAGNSKSEKRRSFSKHTKKIVLLSQNFGCKKCSSFLEYPEFHHIDGNRSNNNIWNCEALCASCHAKRTRKRYTLR